MCDLNIKREDGFAYVTSDSDEGEEFLNSQYGGNLKLEESCLSFFEEYVNRIGLTLRLLML